MSIVSNLVGRARRPAAFSPDIARQLEEAERDLASLEVQHGELAFDDLSGVEGAQERLTACAEQVARTRERLSTLRAAHKVAVERDAATERAQRSQLRKTQIRAVQSHLAARDEAAEKMCAALTEATKQYRIMIERSEKAQAANPIGGKWPWGSMCDFADIKRGIEFELYRVGGDARIGGGGSFPGAAISPEYRFQPDKIPPLTDQVKQASQHVLAVLTGEKTESGRGNA